MHQPPYRDPISGKATMPWTWLHAMRDYLDMPALAAAAGAHVTVNLVPSLLMQLDEYTRAGLSDRFMDVFLTPAVRLSDPQKAFLVDNFFEIHRDSMIAPYPRFQELETRTRPLAADQPRRWKGLGADDLRDLQVWYYLVWCGELLKQNPVVAALLAKGRGFTEDEKLAFHQEVSTFVGGYREAYRRWATEAGLEVSASPLYHPILPLLLGTEAAQVARPGVNLPVERFSHPGDAEVQASEGRKLVADSLGVPVNGMWPPEGSISPKVLAMLDAQGVSWVASDGDLLGKALGRSPSADELYQPWRVGRTAIFFRDHRLSDLLGFVYSKWEPEKAAQHFRDLVLRAAECCSRRERPPVVTVALDGENAWEYYEHGGYKFLATLYRVLGECPEITLCTPSEVLAQEGASGVQELHNPPTGSWINADFSTWIGDPVKNRAWEILAAARRTVDAWLIGAGAGSSPERQAILMDLVYRAEASDWFWWFGEGHSSKFDPEFDFLFRQHVRALYRLMDIEAPPDLDTPLGRKVEDTAWILYPTRLINPRVSGKRDSFYKWQGGGRVNLEHGAIHHGSLQLTGLHFGFNNDKLFLKLESRSPLRKLLEEGQRLELVLKRPVTRAWSFSLGADGELHWAGQPGGAAPEGAELAIGTVLELALPLEAIRNGVPVVGSEVELFVRVLEGDNELERFPSNRTVVFRVLGPELDLENWVV
jgi:alpha-amylase/alpha-mannosidase (GH57 family)